MALGNLVDIKIVAGFCKEHDNSIESDINGCYGGLFKYKTWRIKVSFYLGSYGVC